MSIHERVDPEIVMALARWRDGRGPDPLAELPGYRGSMTLVARGRGDLVGIAFYATTQQAHDADALLATAPPHLLARIPERLGPMLAVPPGRAAVYEIVHRD